LDRRKLRKEFDGKSAEKCMDTSYIIFLPKPEENMGKFLHLKFSSHPQNNSDSNR